MAEIASAFVSLMPSAQSFGKKLDGQISGDIDKSGKKAGLSFGKLFAAGIGLGIGAKAFSFLGDSIAEGREAQKVGALTANAIKATGGAANVTAGQVGKLTSALSMKTGIDDEAIQSGANLLLTFKNVANEAGKGSAIFDRATAAAVDLSAAGFGSLEGTSKQLGKALNDPLKGISALGRAGVTFTEGQQKMIKGFVESGDVLSAQKVILGEVEGQVGGAAAASATAGEKASVALGNLKEQIGTALLPVVDSAAGAFVKFAPAISKGIGAIGPAFSQARTTVTPFLTDLRDQLLPVVTQIGNFVTGTAVPALKSFGGTLLANKDVVVAVGAGLIASKVAMVAYAAYTKVVTAITATWNVVQKLLNGTLKANPIGLVVTAIGLLVGGLVLAYKRSDTFRAIVDKVAGVLKDNVLPVVTKFAGYLAGALISAVKSAISIIGNIIGKVVDFGGAVVDGVQKVGEFAGKVKEKIGNVLGFFRDLPGDIKSAIGDAGSMLLQAGKDIISGLINGIKSMAGSLVSTIKSYVIDKIPGPVKKALGIASPSKVFREIGVNTTQGLIDGLASMKGKLEKATRESLTKSLDAARNRLASLKGDFKSLKDSVANAFTGDLFNVSAMTDEAGNVTQTVGQAFIANLTAKKSELQSLLGSFKTLVGWGVPASFLSQLFASGGASLITEIAGMGQAGAKSTASLFGDVMDLGSQLGNAVATNDYGPDIREQTAEIKAMRVEIAKLPKAVKEGAKEGARDGAKQGTREGNDERSKDTRQRERAAR